MSIPEPNVPAIGEDFEVIKIEELEGIIAPTPSIPIPPPIPHH